MFLVFIVAAVYPLPFKRVSLVQVNVFVESETTNKPYGAICTKVDSILIRTLR